MGPEVQNIEEDIPALAEAPPVVVDVKPTNGKAPKRDKPRERDKDDDGDDEDARGHVKKLSKPLQEAQRVEDVALREWLSGFGLAENAFRLSIARVEPKYAVDKITGERVQVGGHLENVSHFIDEDWLLDKHGGGKFRVTVKVPNNEGKYVFFKNRDLDVAGDPRTDSIPRNREEGTMTKPAASAAPSENPSVVTKAMDMMERQLEHTRTAAAQATTPDNSALMEVFKAELAARTLEIAELRKELVAAQNKAPPKDEIKDQLLTSMLQGESGRITSLRTQFESEIRTLKENARADMDRVQDRHERDLERQRQSHERELTMLRQQHDLTLQQVKQSHEIALASAKSAYDTNVKVLEAQNRSIDKDNTKLEVENKELRAKKDKTIVEQLKEIEIIKEAFGDDDKEETAVDKILGVIADPATLQFAGKLLGKGAPATGTPAAPAPAQPKFRRQVVKADNGKKYLLEPDGRMTGPVRNKNVAPGEPDLPDIPAEQVTAAVSFLEQAFGKNAPPAEIAQGIRLVIPAEIAQAIATIGIDKFMQSVAKLPATSVLANQKGRNWLRAVAKELT